MEKIICSVDYIETHLYERIDIYDIAESSNLSLHHFSRSFKEIVGEPPIVYLRKRRMTIAAKRLILEQSDIMDIALDLQFGSQQAFTRAFKSHFQRSPARYRKEGISDTSRYIEPFKR